MANSDVLGLLLCGHDAYPALLDALGCLVGLAAAGAVDALG